MAHADSFIDDPESFQQSGGSHIVLLQFITHILVSPSYPGLSLALLVSDFVLILFSRIAKVFDEMFELASSCWAQEPSARPSIVALHASFSSLLERETARLPPARDVGLACFEALEHDRGTRRQLIRGGSVIRSY